MADGTHTLRGMARRLGVDPKTVISYRNRIHQNNCIDKISTNASLINHTFEESRILRRKAIEEVIKQDPRLTRTQIRYKAPSAYIWLYRYDKDWLKAILPERVSKSPVNSRVDWSRRDEELSFQIVQAVIYLLLLPGKPIRITKSSIGRQIGEKAIIEKHLERLPKTRQILGELVDSQEQVQIRRLFWAAQEFAFQGENIAAWKIIRKAGLKPGYSRNVKEKIDFLVCSTNE